MKTSIKPFIAVFLIAAITTSVGGLVFSAVSTDSPRLPEIAVADKSEKTDKDASTNASGEEKKSKKKKGKTSSAETNKAPSAGSAAPASNR